MPGPLVNGASQQPSSPARPRSSLDIHSMNLSDQRLKGKDVNQRGHTWPTVPGICTQPAAQAYGPPYSRSNARAGTRQRPDARPEVTQPCGSSMSGRQRAPPGPVSVANKQLQGSEAENKPYDHDHPADDRDERQHPHNEQRRRERPERRPSRTLAIAEDEVTYEKSG